MKLKNKNIQKELELFDIRKYGQYFVPNEIIKFLFNITKPTTNEKVLLIGFYEYSLEKIIGDLFSGIVISSEEIPNDLANQTFDVILCAPFFGKMHPETNESNEEMWLKWSISHLKTSGRIGFILPIGLLSNYSQEPIRQFLLEESSIQSIIEMPTGWAQGTSIQASILIAKSKNDNNKIVRFFRLLSPKFSWTSLEKEVLSNTPTIPKNVVGKAFTIEINNLDSKRLDAKFYDPIYDIKIPNSDYQEVALSDIVEIRSGERFSDTDFSENGIPFVKVGNITTDGNLYLSEIKRIKPEIAINSRGFCQMNDILITIAGTVGKVTRINNNENICIDTSIRKLKVLNKDQILPEYLELFLRSDFSQRQMEKSFSGSVIKVLSTPNLEQLVVFIPNIEKQCECISVFNELIYQRKHALLSKFPDIAGMNSISTATKNNILIDIETGNEKFETIIKKDFPFSIARPFSAYHASTNDISSNQIKKLVSLSESIVYFLYNILLADYTHRLKGKFTDFQYPIKHSIEDYSIDRRIKFINEIIKIAKENANLSLFIPELLGSEIWVCQNIHNQVRNKLAHTDRSETWCKKMLDDYHPKIMKLLSSLRFLSNYRLAQIKTISVRNGRILHSIMSMTGDNSLFQTQVEDLDNILPTDTNHIILINQDYDVLDLYPFYVFHAWESTGLQNHLCYLKQIFLKGNKKKIRLESIEGSGEVDIEMDTNLNRFFSNIS